MEDSYLTFMRNCILGGDTFGVKPNELLYLLSEGTIMEDSYLTFMRNFLLGGDNFGGFRGDKIQKGTIFNFTVFSDCFTF